MYDINTPDNTTIPACSYLWEATGQFTATPGATMAATGEITLAREYPYGMLRDTLIEQNDLAKTITSGPAELVDFTLKAA